MGGIGRQNPCSFQIGGGKTELQVLWEEMRKALGEGGAGPIGGTEDAWRWAKAEMLASATRSELRALLQIWPNRATDHLPVWEENLLVELQDTEQGRRNAISAAYTSAIAATIPGLTESLQQVDSTIGILISTDTDSFHFIPGRYLRPRDAGAADYGVNASSAFPTFSTWFVVRVLWPGGIPDAAARTRIEQILNNTLSSWVDWQIINQQGLYCDGFNNSYLDLSGVFA